MILMKNRFSGDSSSLGLCVAGRRDPVLHASDTAEALVPRGAGGAVYVDPGYSEISVLVHY